jgi:PAS domain S-box-containing protein
MKFKGRIRKKIAFKEEQKEILDQRGYLESIISSITDSLIVVNPDATLRSVNKATLDLLGYREDELIGQPVKIIFLQEEESILHKYFQKIIDAGVRYNIGLTLLTKQGKAIPVNFSGALMQQDGKIIGIVGVARDIRQIMAIISDLEKKEAELEERSKTLTRMQRAMLHIMDDLDIAKKEMHKVNKELQTLDGLRSDFVSTVSHELRTPLTTMKEFASIILDEIPGKLTKEQKEYMDIISGNIDRLARLINNLLDISKIESGRVELKRALVDIPNLANSVISIIKPEAQGKHIEFKTLFPVAALNVYADPDKVVQVFTNLIGNAIKFTEENGEITVEIKDTEQEAICSIADTGIGIAPENLDKIFGKFQQFGREPGGGAKGTGLGLAISKELVEMHNGRIWAESKPGKGSKFIFTLPKHNKEYILHETVEKRIGGAKKENKEVSIFIIRLDDYLEFEEKLEKDGAQKVFLPILASVEDVMRNEDFLTLSSKNEIIVLAQLNKQEASDIRARLKRIIKEHTFEIDAQLEKGFSYGYATYPDDADNAKDLLERAYKSCVQEREARLKKTIMIVDDQPELRNLLKKILYSSGYSNFREAGDGNEALEKINTAIPDLLILDLKMPRMSGYEVIGMLKENAQTKDIPVLIMSGYAVEVGKLEEYVKKKAIPVVAKPFNIEQLKKLVNYLL